MPESSRPVPVRAPATASIPAAPTPVGPLIPPPPPDRPRVLTPFVRGRFYADPVLRFWLLVSLTLLAIAAFYFTTEVLDWWREASIIAKNVIVQATVVEAIGNGGPTRLPGKQESPGTVVTIDYTVNNQPVELSGQVLDLQGFITVGQTLPIHVDPANPTAYTVHAAPPELALQLVAVGVIAPVILIGFALTYLRQRWLMKTWRHGEADPYVVLGSKLSPLSPLSRAIDCTLHDGSDRRIVRVTVPTKLFDAKEGAILWLIHPSRDLSRAIPAIVYDERAARTGQ
jgi:hypothetical protein